jgi:hypothetical protein
MQRRKFLQNTAIGISSGLLPFVGKAETVDFNTNQKYSGDARTYWVNMLHKIAMPVMQNMANNTLKKNMPLEVGPGYAKKVKDVTYLEAFGRTTSGLAPWLNLGEDETKEGQLRSKYINWFKRGLENGINPSADDYLNFDLKTDMQPLVDIAYLVQAFMRAPGQLWNPLEDAVKKQTIHQLKQLRWILPSYNNWLLFAAIVEIFYWWAGEEDWDAMRVDYAIRTMEDWYKGDGYYGDGPRLHVDYYNDYVIFPMLLEVLHEMVEKGKLRKEEFEKVMTRAKRHAVIEERLIAPDASYPIVGRSAPYRITAFQNLSWLSLKEQLPVELKEGQVKAAITAVMKRIYEFPDTFDKNGWLQIGVCGHQNEIADDYTSTGSLYICTNAFLPLGLSPGHTFWIAPDEEWTSQKIWSGKVVKKDHYIKE